MKCSKCGSLVDDSVEKCPVCNTNNVLLESTSNYAFVNSNSNKRIKNTKRKKIEDGDPSFDKTIAISINNNETLLDEINKQIDLVNREALNENILVEKVNDVDNELNTLDSLRKRRIVFVMTIFASFLLLCSFSVIFVIYNYYFTDSQTKAESEITVYTAMTNYYNTSEVDDVVYLLDIIKSDENKVKLFQEDVKKICLEWTDEYLNKELKSKNDFEIITSKYRDLIDGIYRYAIVKNDNQYIRALNEVDYDLIIDDFEKIYYDGLDFYQGLDFFYEKDYNKAYYMFSKINDDNHYYKKSVFYIENIYKEIILLLNKDITKISKDIELLEDEEKLKIYVLIEETILEYNIIYTIDLSNNIEYQQLLDYYEELVVQYSDLVYK